MLWELWGRSERQPHISQEQKKGADWFSRKEERLGIGGVRQDHSRSGEPYGSEVWDPGLVWGNCKFLSIFRGRRVEINETKRIWMRIWPREFGQDGVGNVHHAQLSRPNPEDWSRKWQPTPVFLHGKFHKQRSLVYCSPWGHTELSTTEWLSTQSRRQRGTIQGFYTRE